MTEGLGPAQRWGWCFLSNDAPISECRMQKGGYACNLIYECGVNVIDIERIISYKVLCDV